MGKKTKMNVGSRVEGIFAQAVAMDNRGIRNTIYCIGKNIYIVNFDHSMLLRFSLRKNEGVFAKPVSFNVNEYDSPNFEFDEGRIAFITDTPEYTRRKICNTEDSGPTAEGISELYSTLISNPGAFSFHLSEGIVSLLEEGMSHVEISVEDSQLMIRQRNIYTGTLVEITKRKAGLFTVDGLPKEHKPIALKTKDFASLFNIDKSLKFSLAEDYMTVEDSKGDFDGVLAFCRYDSIINLYDKEGNESGREKPKARAGKQKADRPAEKRVVRRSRKK